MEKQETIADIIAEMRKSDCDEICPWWADGGSCDFCPLGKSGKNCSFSSYSDRLEAAWKREKTAIEADALDVGGFVEASRKREMSKNTSKNGADFGQLGDNAKMRETLEFADSELRRATEDDRFGNDLVYLVGCMRTVAGACRAALAASRATAKKSLAVGDCAKMREALKRCREIVLQWQADEAAGVAGTTDKPEARSASEALIEIELVAEAALAEPVRNCEVGTAEEQARRFLKYCVKQDCEKACPFRDCKNSYECAFGWAQMPYEEGGAK